MKYDYHKYIEKRHKKEQQILQKWRKRGYLKDSERLELLSFIIVPYSSYSRLGCMKALKRAIKLLKKEEKECGQ